MSSSFAFPILGLTAVAGSLLGLHLGRDSIAQINPVHFQGAAVHPRDRGVAIQEEALAADPARRPGASRWDVPYPGDCLDCESLPARDHYADDPYARDAAFAPSQSAPVIVTIYRDAAPAEYRDVAWEEVERYASFEIEAERYE